ncbi:MAG: T9SS type A sorting domain-containing protein [Cytophagales bacterium]|nr:T9SS type A sorting domain-containing protein [Cytophaga sp.]
MYADRGSFYKYDAYGTLKTVYGTYYNVVRMFSSEADTITVDYGFGTFQAVSYYFTYTWMQPGSTTPLFTIMEARIFSQDINIKNSSMTAAVLFEPPAIATSVTHSSPGIALTVTPNPASDLIMIDFADLESGMYEVTVLNTDGTLQHTEKFYAAKGSVHPVNISAYSNGMYVLHLNTPAGMGSKKFVKI